MSYDVTVGPANTTMEPYDANLTYNVGTMLRRAGIHPEVMNGLTAKVARSVVGNGMATMSACPVYFKSFEPDNGWGSYDGTMEWLDRLQSYLNRCPDDYVVEWR